MFFYGIVQRNTKQVKLIGRRVLSNIFDVTQRQTANDFGYRVTKSENTFRLRTTGVIILFYIVILIVNMP